MDPPPRPRRQTEPSSEVAGLRQLPLADGARVISQDAGQAHTLWRLHKLSIPAHLSEHDLCRVNFEVNAPKPLPHLVFPQFVELKTTRKMPRIDGRIDGKFLRFVRPVIWVRPSLWNG